MVLLVPKYKTICPILKVLKHFKTYKNIVLVYLKVSILIKIKVTKVLVLENRQNYCEVCIDNV